MATLFNIDFTRFATQMLPPDKRNPVLMALLNAFLVPLQWASQHRIVEFGAGSFAAAWSNITTYNKYDQVILNKVVYQSLISGNTSSPLTSNWAIIQSNFIGLNERIQYNGECLVLTYALNKWFGTIFRQPPAISDIYINTNVLVTPIFRVGKTEAVSSSISTIGSSEFIGISDGITSQINLSIFVPIAVYNALDVTLINNDKIFRNFADRYIPAGIVYQITTY